MHAQRGRAVGGSCVHAWEARGIKIMGVGTRMHAIAHPCTLSAPEPKKVSHPCSIESELIGQVKRFTYKHLDVWSGGRLVNQLSSCL